MAKASPRQRSIDSAPAYLYLEYGPRADGSGLHDAFRNPTTRAAVVRCLEQITGSPLIAGALTDAADKHNIDPALLTALAWKESRFNPTASGTNNNRTVDRGLMQLNSATFPALSSEDFYDPRLNADLGAGYLRAALNLSGKTISALAMYNAGPGRVESRGTPLKTLEYISDILAFREEIARYYFDLNSAGGVLVSLRARPVKNPDFL